MPSGKRILGLLLIIIGLSVVAFGVAALVASLDRPLTLTVLGLFPYLALIGGGGMLLGGIKLVKSAGQAANQPADAAESGATATSTSALAAVAVMILGGWYYFGGGLQMQTNRTLQEIHDKVAADTVAQYGIAKRNGTEIDVCVQAGLVAAAYLQAQNEPQYQQWKKTEKEDCAKAGIEK